MPNAIARISLLFVLSIALIGCAHRTKEVQSIKSTDHPWLAEANTEYERAIVKVRQGFFIQMTHAQESALAKGDVTEVANISQECQRVASEPTLPLDIAPTPQERQALVVPPALNQFRSSITRAAIMGYRI